MKTVGQIALQLQADIRRKDWADAGKLPGQRELAAQLGVSRASLREAVVMLESLGLVRSEGGRGVFIVKHGDKSSESANRRWRLQERYALRDVYLVRENLEELAVALATGVITTDGLSRLGGTIDRMRTAADAQDLVAMADADRAFHSAILEIAGCPMLSDLADRIADVANRSRQIAFADPRRVRDPIREHEHVLKAMAGGSEKAARKAMRTHICKAAARVGVQLVVPGV